MGTLKNKKVSFKRYYNGDSVITLAGEHLNNGVIKDDEAFINYKGGEIPVFMIKRDNGEPYFVQKNDVTFLDE
jgi:hypothetical protein